MKKLLSFLLILSTVVLCFASCKNKETSSVPEKENEKITVTKNAYVLYEKGDTYSEELKKYFSETFKKDKETTVNEESFEGKDADFLSFMQNAQKNNAGFIFAPTAADKAIKILEAFKAANLKCPVFSGDKWKTDEISAFAKENGIVLFCCDRFDENADIENIQTFVADFKNWLNTNKDKYDLNGGCDTINTLSALGYEAYNVLYNSIRTAADKKIEALTSADVASKMISEPYIGLLGETNFDGDGMADKNGGFVSRAKDGKFSFVAFQKAPSMTPKKTAYDFSKDVKKSVGIDKSAKKITIAVFESLSGSNAQKGAYEYLGMLYANSKRPVMTINGTSYKIELKVFDNSSDEQKAVEMAEKAAEEKVIAALGSYGNGVSYKAAPVFNEAKIPFLSPSCNSPNFAKNEYCFSMGFKDCFEGSVIAKYALSIAA